MSTRMQIPHGERGLVRVFAIDLEPEAARAFADGAPQSVADALGTDALGARHVEVIDLADLKGLGLSGYLMQGIGVAPDALDGERERLDAMTGRVVLVLSGAFEDRARELTVAPPLRWVGTYPETRPTTPEIPLATPSAEGLAVGGPGGTPVPVSSSRGAMWVLITLAVVALVILIAVF